MHEEELEACSGLPQCPEGWNFDSPTGQRKGGCAFWADREEVGGNLFGQFVDFEDVSRHGGGTRERNVEI